MFDYCQQFLEQVEMPKWVDDPLVSISAVHLRAALRRRRHEQSASEIAARAGISRQRLAILVAGLNMRCRRSVRADLARALKCRVRELNGTLDFADAVSLQPRPTSTDRLRANSPESMDQPRARGDRSSRPDSTLPSWTTFVLNTIIEFTAEATKATRTEMIQVDFADAMTHLMDLYFWRSLLAPVALTMRATDEDRERFAVLIADAMEMVVGGHDQSRRDRSTVPPVLDQFRTRLPGLAANMSRKSPAIVGSTAPPD